LAPGGIAGRQDHQVGGQQVEAGHVEGGQQAVLGLRGRLEAEDPAVRPGQG
jgi:hypothetical protein